MTGAPNDVGLRRGLALRALEHVRRGTTDQADTHLHLPVSAYLDEQRYQEEVRRVFVDGPIAIALSLELPEANSYRAFTVLGKPLLLTRDNDLRVRAFLNVCRHRGAQICAEGSGVKDRFTCPYHAWTYDSSGALVKVYGEEAFGSFDLATRGLTELTCEERHGVVFCCLNPRRTFSIDPWLQDMGDALAALKLDDWVLYEQRDLVGPGWKVAFDGYLEVYHHDIVHRSTVGQHTIGNLLVHDTFGPHQRLTFGRKTLKEVQGELAGDWDPDQYIRIVHSVFPNLSISGIVGGHCLVSQVFPGEDLSRTVTRQSILCAKGTRDAAWEEAASTFSRLALEAVRDEDYALGLSVQSALPSGANDDFMLGRNEPGVQHYHRTLAAIMDGSHPALNALGERE